MVQFGRVLRLLVLLGTLGAAAVIEAQTLVSRDFNDGTTGGFFIGPQAGGVGASGSVQAGELVMVLDTSGASSNWLAGARAYYLPTLNTVTDRSRLFLRFRLRGDFASTGSEGAFVRVRIYGFGTGEERSLWRDFPVTADSVLHQTSLDTWNGSLDFDPTREAHAIYFDVGGNIGFPSWPAGVGTRLLVDDVLYALDLPPIARAAVEYFVAPDGSDAADGLSPATAFATVQRAADLTLPGDIVTVLDGDYPGTELRITRSGAPGAPITYRAANRHGAKLHNPWSDVIRIGSSARRVGYIVIDGFDLQTSGVFGSGVKSSRGAHHLYVKNNYAHDCGESGIQLNDGDYRFIEGNITARNGWLMPDAGSGISLWGLQPFDDAPGWHTIVRNNISYANDNGPNTARTDGNGIIIDDFRNTQSGHTGSPVFQPTYVGYPTLVEGNLVFGNGGKGIQVFVSNQVHVIHNTAYLNNRRADIETWRGEINVSASANVVVANNLAVTDSSPVHATAAFNTAFLAATPHGSTPGSGALYGVNNVFRHNVALDLHRPGQLSMYVENIASAFLASDGNRIATEHGMVAPTLDPGLVDAARAAAFFGLMPDALARDAGDDVLAESGSDISGWPRRTGQAVDAGAYEFAPRSHWWATRLGTVSLLGDNASDQDPDGDGRPNLLEYAFDTDPLMADAAPSQREPRLDVDGVFSFERLRADLDYTIERSDNLAEWNVWLVNPGAPGETVGLTLPDSPARVFLRLRVTPSQE